MNLYADCSYCGGEVVERIDPKSIQRWAGFVGMRERDPVFVKLSNLPESPNGVLYIASAR